MLKKINRRDALLQFPRFPQADTRKDRYFFPPTYKGYILTLASKSARSHATKLAAALSTLTTDMRYERLVFLGDSTNAWLFQQNEYPPVKKALYYLLANKTGKRFNGAFIVPASELPEFITHLFWLVRCNASLPCIHFCDSKQQVMGSICQYGNVHFFTLHKTADKQFQVALSQSVFATLDPGLRCSEPFSATGAIRARQTIL